MTDDGITFHIPYIYYVMYVHRTRKVVSLVLYLLLLTIFNLDSFGCCKYNNMALIL